MIVLIAFERLLNCSNKRGKGTGPTSSIAAGKFVTTEEKGKKTVALPDRGDDGMKLIIAQHHARPCGGDERDDTTSRGDTHIFT